MKNSIRNSASCKILAALLLAGCCQGAFADGPFGLAMGTSKQELDLKPNDGASNTYLFESVPVPSRHFEIYAGGVGDRAGLCNIRSLTGAIDTNRFGHGLRSRFDEIKAALTERYGEPTLFDMVIPGSLWNEPQDFMMGMLREDRKLVAFWNNADAPLGSDLQGIMLESRALSTTSGIVILQYDFLNADECRAEDDSMKNRGL